MKAIRFTYLGDEVALAVGGFSLAHLAVVVYGADFYSGGKSLLELGNSLDVLVARVKSEDKHGCGAS